MDKITGFINGIFKGKMDLSKIGGLDGLLEKVKSLSNAEGQVDIGKLKKLVMPFASQFMGDSVKKFFEENKGKTTVKTDDALNYFKENIKVEVNKPEESEKPVVEEKKEEPTPAAS